MITQSFKKVLNFAVTKKISVYVVGYANPNPIELYMLIRLAALFVAGNLVFGSLACSGCVSPLRCNTKKSVGVNHLNLF